MKYFSNSIHSFGWARIVACVILAATLLSACGTEEEKQQVVGVNSEQSIAERIANATDAINANRLDASAFNRRAALHLINGSIAAAEDDIKVAMKIDNKVADFHYTSSDIHFAKGEIVLATEALSDGLELDPENVTALLALAELYYSMRDMKRSVILIKRVLAIEKYNAQAYLIHGLVFIELGDTARALASFQRATENDPKMEQAFLELGMIHYARLNPLTVDYLNNVISLNPKSTLAIYTKGMYYQKAGEIDLAIDTYNEMLNANPGHPEALYNLGHIEFEHKSDFKTAIAHFNKVIASDSSHYKAFYMRGLSMESMSKFSEAREDYKKSLSLETNYALAIEGLNRLDNQGH